MYPSLWNEVRSGQPVLQCVMGLFHIDSVITIRAKPDIRENLYKATTHFKLYIPSLKPLQCVWGGTPNLKSRPTDIRDGPIIRMDFTILTTSYLSREPLLSTHTDSAYEVSTMNGQYFKVDGFYCGVRKDLGVGGWGPGIPYCVRILKSVRIIGPSLSS